MSRTIEIEMATRKCLENSTCNLLGKLSRKLIPQYRLLQKENSHFGNPLSIWNGVQQPLSWILNHQLCDNDWDGRILHLIPFYFTGVIVVTWLFLLRWVWWVRSPHGVSFCVIHKFLIWMWVFFVSFHSKWHCSVWWLLFLDFLWNPRIGVYIHIAMDDDDDDNKEAV